MSTWDIVPSAVLVFGALLIFCIGYLTAKRRIIILHSIMASIRGLVFAFGFVVILFVAALILYPEEWLLAKPAADWEKSALDADAIVVFSYGLGAPVAGVMTPGESNLYLFKWVQDHTRSPVIFVQQGGWLAADCDKPSSQRQGAVQTIRQMPKDEEPAEQPQENTALPQQDGSPTDETPSLVEAAIPVQDVQSNPVGETEVRETPMPAASASEEVMPTAPSMPVETESMPEPVIEDANTCLVNGRKVVRMYSHDENVCVNTNQAARCAAEKFSNLDTKKRVVVVAHDLQMQQAVWNFERSLRSLAQYEVEIIVPDVGKVVAPKSFTHPQTGARVLYKLVQVFWERPRDYLSYPPEGSPTACK